MRSSAFRPSLPTASAFLLFSLASSEDVEFADVEAGPRPEGLLDPRRLFVGMLHLAHPFLNVWQGKLALLLPDEGLRALLDLLFNVRHGVSVVAQVTHVQHMHHHARSLSEFTCETSGPIEIR
eukprot:scaffold1833_cov255-Pinguiococcus_pyrenoidosus.AAC.14